jgi:hypothetical protein
MPTRSRQKPGSSGKGEYYHVEVLPDTGFVTFRTQDVGKQGHIQRVAGKRSSGSWETVKWLIGKDDAHVQGNKLVPDTKGARDVLKEIGAQPVHLNGDIFKAKGRSPSNGNASSTSSKSSAAQVRARRENIKKAQAARWKRR